MRTSIWLGTAVLAGVSAFSMTASAGESPMSPQPEVVGYVFCTAIQNQREMPDESIRPGVIYYSGAFVMKGQNLNPMTAAFLAFLDKKYGYKPDPNDAMPVSCTDVHSLAEAQSIEKMRVAQGRKAGGNVIETGWTYAAAKP